MLIPLRTSTGISIEHEPLLSDSIHLFTFSIARAILNGSFELDTFASGCGTALTPASISFAVNFSSNPEIDAYCVCNALTEASSVFVSSFGAGHLPSTF